MRERIGEAERRHKALIGDDAADFAIGALGSREMTVLAYLFHSPTRAIRTLDEVAIGVV